MPHIDADLVNADWVKTLSWPFAEWPIEEWEKIPLDQLAHMTTLPVWAQAPDDVRQLVQARLESEIT